MDDVSVADMADQRQSVRHETKWRIIWYFGISIVILILLSLMIPVSGPRRINRPVQTNVEIAGLCEAIRAYEMDYGRLPCFVSETNQDTTFGIVPADVQIFKSDTTMIPSNTDIIIVLMDLDMGINAGHKHNPRQIRYLAPRIGEGKKPSGVSTNDYQYRDPWGNPYVISLDANQDGFVRDAFYANPSLYADGNSAPLMKTNDLYELKDQVMVWSRGPNGKVDSATPLDSEANRDNITSWQ